MTARGKRINKGEIFTIGKYCKHCGHHKAWSKNSGVFCTRCGKKLIK